ncbi:MAG: acyl-CoA dehydrogenase family protein [Thermoplasmatota archaeon]
MELDPTEQEMEFRREVDAVLSEHISPRTAEWRRMGTTSREFFEILGENWLLGYRFRNASISQIPWLENIYFYRELSRISGGLAIAAFVHSQTGLKAIHAFGNRRQYERYLVPGMKGSMIMAIANTEPGAGSDVSAISLEAQDRGDHWLLNGTKSYITSGDIADAIVTTAVTDPSAEKPHRGISMFVIDGMSEGLERSRMDKYGWAESHLSTLVFEDVKVTKDNLIGAQNMGFYQTMEVFNSSRIGIAAIAHGSALGAFKMAYDYNRRRKVFGQTIFDNGSKRAEYADRMTFLEAGWLLVQKAAYMHDRGRDYLQYSSMAKLFNTEEGHRISHWAALNFGARGLLSGHPVSQYPLDSTAAMMGEGAPEVQRKIVSENLDSILDGL